MLELRVAMLKCGHKQGEMGHCSFSWVKVWLQDFVVFVMNLYKHCNWNHCEASVPENKGKEFFILSAYILNHKTP